MMPRRPKWGQVIWFCAMAVVVVALVDTAGSPLLQWRDTAYVVAGFAGVVGLGLVLVQQLLVVLGVPNLSAATARRLHRVSGMALVLSVFLHVALLWITSPPDVIDSLTLQAPTWFSVWGVGAMWAVFATALIGANRRRMPAHVWRFVHRILGYGIGIGGIAHAMLIDGAMGNMSKAVLCACVGAAMIMVLRTKRWLFHAHTAGRQSDIHGK